MDAVMPPGDRIATLRTALIRGGVAAPDQILGSPPEEIAALEARYGIFPDSYRAVLALMGRGAGNFTRHDEFWLFARQFEHINREGWTCVADYAEDGIALDVPPDAVFISARYGADYPHFLRSGPAPDSPVWAIDSDVGLVKPACASVYDWIEGFLVDHPAARALLPSRR